MTGIKKFFLVAILIVTPVATGLAIYLNVRYHLSPFCSLAISIAPGVILIAIASFRFYWKFYVKTLSQVAERTGLNSVSTFKSSRIVPGRILLEGNYKCAVWEIAIFHQSNKYAVFSDDRLLLVARFISEPDAERINKKLKSMKKIAYAKWVNPRTLAVVVYVADVDDAGTLINVMDAICE
ncbi:hypothetical protein [Desulfurobacterium sp.]